MVPLELRIFAFTILAAYSTGPSSANQNGVPSEITINENFRDPILLPPRLPYGPTPFVSNFVHQGTNFFFNPQFLLGTYVPPQIGAIITADKENIADISITPEDYEMAEPELITPVQPQSIIIEEPIIIQPPFPSPIIFNESIIVPPPASPPLIPIEIPVIRDQIVIKEIPPAPILPPLELPKIPVIIEEPVEILPTCYEKDVLIPKVGYIPPIIRYDISAEPATMGLPIVGLQPPRELVFPVEPELRLSEKASIQIMPEKPKIKIIEIPDAPEFPLFEMPDIPTFLDKGETVVLVPPVPEVPAIITQSYAVEPISLKRIVDLPIPTACARDIVVERVLPNIIISKKFVTKSIELIVFPTAE